ncbi:RAMP superfamily CRISPR-associated protein [[Mannheimia] succiniciproducens]|uniref:CRISPR system Cms protein Csm5 n=1 Tax=Mannheimia succiniciproducens (strain KCTC 0769BP / MBEL55E) TaxID=221988 RepID=Q65S06_MANSM|nr:RAMP superfamily CRISPR-associated protein [[Mannheimia] succiniciproducens]AAU38254.1 unknown [[Mannheimia] succiniciproducens MBEL55E]
MKFMQTHKIYLTPISPIHIGCGEDFEPTNYVIDNEVLFNFDPANLALNNRQKTELLNRVNRLDLLSIQRFFLENKEKVLSSTYYFADVAEGLANDYKNKVGKVAQRESDGNKVINNLSIERTAFLPVKHLPYIPASGFKGALATALLDQAHQAKNNPRVNKNDHGKLFKEYIGEFAESKLRFVKFADFSPLVQAESKIYYALNFKKKVGKIGGEGRAMALRRECIKSGQYRAFLSELALMQGDANKMQIADYFTLLKNFYLPIFKQEAELLAERNLVNRHYLKQLEQLFNLPNVALIRLGKNGADSKTYQADGIAQIKIMGAKGTPLNFKDSSTTVWLAGTNQQQQNDLLPFGWAIIEADPTAENEPLKQWCDAQPKSKFNRSVILAKREEQKAKQAQLKAEEEAKQQAKLAEEKAKAEMLNSLSDNQRLIMDFVEKLKNTSERQADNTGSPLLKEAEALINQAIEWENAERQFACEQITVELLKSGIRITGLKQGYKRPASISRTSVDMSAP